MQNLIEQTGSGTKATASMALVCFVFVKSPVKENCAHSQTSHATTLPQNIAQNKKPKINIVNEYVHVATKYCSR